MNRTNLKVCRTAINKALADHASGLRMELAVAFAVILDSGKARRLARAVLCECYAAAGLQCSQPGDRDWRSINRRIGAALALFDFIGLDEITKWANGKQRTELLDALAAQLAPLKLRTVSEILEVCGKIKPRSRSGGASGKSQETPGTQHVDTTNVHVVIPPATTRAELMEVALALMKLAEQIPVEMGDPAVTLADTPQEIEEDATENA